MSTLDLTLYEALVTANVPKETASKVVNALQSEIHKTIERQYEIHNKEAVTRGDIERLRADIDTLRVDTKEFRLEASKNMSEMETRLMRAIVEMQRWTIGALIACSGIVLAISKML